MKYLINPYVKYQCSELPPQLQARLISRMNGGSASAYQWVLNFPLSPGRTFVWQYLIAYPFVGGLCLIFHSILGAILAIPMLALLFFCIAKLGDLQHSLFPPKNRLHNPPKNRLRNGIYVTTHYIIHVWNQEVTYFPMVNVSRLEICQTSHMGHEGRYEREYWLEIENKGGSKSTFSIDWTLSKAMKLPFDYLPLQKELVKCAKSAGEYEAQDDLATESQ